VSGLEGFLIGAVTVLIIVILVLVGMLLSVIKDVRQMASQFGLQATEVQHQLEDRLQRLQLNAEPVMEETHKLLAAAQPILTAAQPAVEQLRAVLAATQPLLAEAHAVILLAKESASLAKATVTSVKTEAESCMAAISATTTELSKMTHDEAEKMRELVADARHRTSQQVARIDQLVTRTTNRIDETADLVQTGVLKPVSELTAMLAAVQRFLQVLFAHERKSIDQAYQDEEMFI
jgi:hypothetical protein